MTAAFFCHLPLPDPSSRGGGSFFASLRLYDPSLYLPWGLLEGARSLRGSGEFSRFSGKIIWRFNPGLSGIKGCLSLLWPERIGFHRGIEPTFPLKEGKKPEKKS